jgi:uncharacterized damage-inducible protein DinB
MTDAARLVKLIAYDEWATGKILDAIDGMTVDELGRPVEAYFGTVDAGLQHILFAMRIWLARWKGEPRPAQPGIPPEKSWREAYAVTHAHLRAFAESLREGDGDRIVDYIDGKGVARALPLGDLIAHVVNHGTQHRAELGLLLERIGRSPGDLDYVGYCYRVQRD